LEHAQETVEGDAGDDDLGVEGGVASKLAGDGEVGEFVGVEGGGVEAVGAGVLIAWRGATLPSAIGSA
jgi:hypothetical protein